ncbi:MAG: ABC transporter permease [Acidobacteria bacterium]|nr:ABC transporter permease [Acidobacteriota bacterium]
MFWKSIRSSLWRPQSRRRALWGLVAVALGTAVAAAMLNVSLDVGDKVGRELRSLGANIVISPAADSLPVEIGGIDYRPVSEGAYISEASLGKLKEIFWRHHIMAFAPFLYLPAQVMTPPVSGMGSAEASSSTTGYSTTLVGTWYDHPYATSDGEQFQTGVRSLNETWQLEGEWIDDSAPADTSPVGVMGRSLANTLGVRSGASVVIALQPSQEQQAPSDEKVEQVTLQVKGILTTGGAEDNQIFASLALAQSLAGVPDQVRKVQVNALIKPEDELSRRDPATMTPQDYDRWYCSPYLSSILYQIGEVLPGTAASPVRQVAETQGNVLSKLLFLMMLLAVLALVAAALSISSLASLTVMERRQEIGLMKAIGAQDWLVAALFLVEASWQGLAGGLLGFWAGYGLAQVVGQQVFGSAVALNWLLLPIILLLALGVSLVGTLVPLSRAARYQPALVLRGE